ncbi:MAG: NAD-dependent epimerase/dehydratase family protein [Rhodospirillales bacterium]|jgi:UDP-glucuronate decarboxylase|nr:NAD-dependent epimerase/dehydratase family protein [Rhodospirillales bacterium]HJO73046.1 NAD-dependent epimerase/dehydratase family protein [Rhodospirillales bacterium]
MSDFFLASDIAEIVDRLGERARGLAGQTVLLSGGCGFLGRYFVAVFDQLNRRVLEEPCTVVVVDNFITAGKEGKAFEGSEHIRLTRHDATQPLAHDGPIDYIIQAAGIASPYYYRAYPLETLEVATVGTKNLLEMARDKGARFCFFSSSEIYGDPDPKHVPTPENYRGNVTCQGPRACYDESKRLGETLCYVYHEMHGVSTNTIRPFNVFGPGMQETDYRVLPNFANRIKGGRALSVYGTGRQTRTFCYVTDAVVGFLLTVLGGVPGEAYNIGNPEPEISMFDLVERIEVVLGRKIEKNLVEYPDSYPADEPNRRCPDIRKARLQLEFEPLVDLDDGLGRFLAWTDATYDGEP